MRCLSCTAVLQPYYCSGIETCIDGDVCITESYISRNGEILYNVGCSSVHRCTSTALQNRSSKLHRKDIIGTHVHDVCKECCHGDLCNAAGCGAAGFPPQRGPICLNCPQSHDPAKCDVISVCRQGEVCHIEEVSIFGDIFYKTSCARQNDYECTSHPVFIPMEIGKRSERRGNCFYCCTGDLCNTQCDQSSVSTTTTVSAKTESTTNTVSSATESTSHVATSTTTTVSLTPPQCLPGWITSPQKCYYVSTTAEKTDWNTAKTRCIAMGAKLVEIKTDEEGYFLNRSMPSYIDTSNGSVVYIGFRRNDSHEWVFDSNNEAVNMTVRSWGHDYVSDYEDFLCGCTEKYYDFKMLMCMCTGYNLFYICEIVR
ncbi:uncharacterized protein [Argopecten irradians]